MEELFARDRNVPRGLLILVPAVALLVVLGMGTYKRVDVPTAGKKVPDFTAPLLVGERDLALSDGAGKGIDLLDAPSSRSV